METSLEMLKRMLKLVPPASAITMHRNEAPSSKMSITAEERAKLVRYCELDLQLYEFAKRLFAKQRSVFNHPVQIEL